MISCFIVSQVVCDLVLCCCVLHTPDLTPPDMTDYTLDSTTGAWPHQEKAHFLTLGFPECSCCLECNIYSRPCHDNGLMLAQRGFPSSKINVDKPCNWQVSKVDCCHNDSTSSHYTRKSVMLCSEHHPQTYTCRPLRSALISSR